MEDAQLLVGINAMDDKHSTLTKRGLIVNLHKSPIFMQHAVSNM